MQPIRCRSMAGQGPASSCASASMALAAGQERAAAARSGGAILPSLFLRRPRHPLLFPAGAVGAAVPGTAELGSLRQRAGGRGRVAGTAVVMLMGARGPHLKPGV